MLFLLVAVLRKVALILALGCHCNELSGNVFTKYSQHRRHSSTMSTGGFGAT
jgi:hypothetical protein